MPTPLSEKSTVAEIRERFDHDVDRFADLATGQSATIDAPLAMTLITEAAIAATPRISRILDVGCGAGNNAIRLLREQGGTAACDLCDLSEPMLTRAAGRIGAETSGAVGTYAGDFRALPLAAASYDVVVAAAVLHHLRDDADWRAAFHKLHGLLRPGGSLWITDLVTHADPRVHALMWQRYGAYLEDLGGADYRDRVFAYIDKEDSPRPLTYQLRLLEAVGFETVEVLHKNACFAAFGALKAAEGTD
jgi:tRNA (cmo5U34)-methyltransferase